MSTKICACCGQPFEPRPQVLKQTYCSLPDCQRARRQRWQRDKMQSDPDYRENQTRNQRAWLDRHPDYWRNYRNTNSKNTTRNRQYQKLSDHTWRGRDPAKMDVSKLVNFRSGLYRITHVQSPCHTQRDSWIVKITPMCTDCPCKKDACKDRM